MIDKCLGDAMTLGELRKLTAGFPDATPLVVEYDSTYFEPTVDAMMLKPPETGMSGWGARECAKDPSELELVIVLK